MIEQAKDQKIKLKRIFIESKLPPELLPLKELANNLWWSWNKDAENLFRTINEEKWEESGYNPVAFLEGISWGTSQKLLADKSFMKALDQVYKDFQAYLKVKPAKGSPSVSYFSMEYGLHSSLRLYSGGLGVLAGDFLKEASDSNVDLRAIGLLYRFGYFQQGITINGDQINNFPPQRFTNLPIIPVRDEQGEWLKISIGIKGRMVFAKIWELKVGRISLYLLDTDLDENNWEDRNLTHQLYGGDNEHRLKQEILLGIGGVRALAALNIHTDIYHCNEGHAAFMGIERLKNLVTNEGLTFAEAKEVVRGSSLFTTHTPVPAGHDYFSEGLLKDYLYNYAFELGIDWTTFIALGKIDPANVHELFSMSHLAIHLSQEVNGVSELHGAVSRKMFNDLYPGFNAEELHIGFVTNGVHYPTWIAKAWHDLYSETFGKNFLQDQSNKDYWRKIHQIPGSKIMEIRQQLKTKLLDYIRSKMQEDLMRRGENPRMIFETQKGINDKALVIGFARRFATYKRAHLLFTNPERLAKLVNNPERPVMFVFSGKAHPADQGGQHLIRQVIEISKRPEFIGKIIFLENYNMNVAKYLVQGVDVWLNTPTRPKEASGTSGMKAALNGIMNFSVLDGWWAEGYRPDAGWSLPLERTYADQELQNQLDAETIYNILENDIIPTYYDRDNDGISTNWVNYIKNTIAEVAPEFTMKRMMDDYLDRFYQKLSKRSKKLQAEDFSEAKSVAAWKESVTEKWNEVEIAKIETFDTDNYALPLGKPFKAKIQLYLAGLEPDVVGVEVVFFRRNRKEELELKQTDELKLIKTDQMMATYEIEMDPKVAGVFEYGFRIFPKHESLPHWQDLNLVYWV